MTREEKIAAISMFNALSSVKEFFDTWQIEIGAAEETLFEEIDQAKSSWIESQPGQRV